MSGSVLTTQDANNGYWLVTILRDCGHTVESPRRLNAEGPAERHGADLLSHPCLSCVLGEGSVSARGSRLDDSLVDAVARELVEQWPMIAKDWLANREQDRMFAGRHIGVPERWAAKKAIAAYRKALEEKAA